MGFMEEASRVVLDAEKRLYKETEEKIENLEYKCPKEDREYFKQRLLNRYRIETGRIFVQHIPTRKDLTPPF